MIIPTKTYEKPESGLFHGVLADIVDLGMVPTRYNDQLRTIPMVRFVWILDVKGKDGKPLSVTQRFNASNLHEKSNIYKTLRQILNAPPPPNFDIELLIGQTRKILVNREKSADGSRDYANVMGILPADPGVTVPIPPDFVRAKFRQVQKQNVAPPISVTVSTSPSMGITPPSIGTTPNPVGSTAVSPVISNTPPGPDIAF
jgi:hypothetical protein